MAQCTATKAGGAPCKGTALPGKTVCWGHDPAQAAARQAITRKAGKAGGQGRPSLASGELTTIKQTLNALVSQVYYNKITAGTAYALNALLNTQLRCIEVERKLHEAEELEARIAALEQAPAGGQRWGA